MNRCSANQDACRDLHFCGRHIGAAHDFYCFAEPLTQDGLDPDRKSNKPKPKRSREMTDDPFVISVGRLKSARDFIATFRSSSSGN